MEPEHTKKKLAEMTVEEKREYAKLAKRKSRDKAKQQRLASQIPAASEYELPKSQKDQLAENARQITSAIAAELPDTLSVESERMVEMLADVLLGYENNWTQQVHSPDGYLYGNHYPDAGEVIDHVHRFPDLLNSRTFADLYQRFLRAVRKLSRNDWFDKDFAKDIESEINGTYSLPDPKMPKAPEPAPAPPAPPVPSSAEILADGRARLLESMRDQLPPDALRYLNGGNR